MRTPGFCRRRRHPAADEGSDVLEAWAKDITRRPEDGWRSASSHMIFRMKRRENNRIRRETLVLLALPALLALGVQTAA